MNITRATTGFKSWIPTRSFFKEMRSFFWLGVIISVLGTLNSFADTFILGNVSAKALAASFATDTIISFADGMITGLGGAFISVLAKKLNSNKIEEAQDGMDLMMMTTFIALVISSLFLGFFARPLLGIFKVDINYSLSYYYIMLGSIFVYGYSSVVARPIYSTSDFKRTAIINLTVLTSNIVISVPLVYVANLGIMGAGIGSLISFAFSLFIKTFLVKSKFGSRIKIAPWRIFAAKFRYLKIIKKTWPTFFTEVFYSASTFITNLILARMFFRGAEVLAIAGVFFSIVIRLANSGGPYSKYLGKSLEEGNITECKQYGKGITTSVIIRTIPFALATTLFGAMLPYMHLYNVDSFVIYDARNTIFAFMLMIPTLPFMMYGINQAMIGGRPTITMVIEIISTWLTIGFLFLAGFYIHDIFYAALIEAGVFTIGSICIYISGSRSWNFIIENHTKT